MSIALAIFLVAAILIFARLGHYALWDDEALIALSAKGILRTGDTIAVIDHNIVAYGNGLLLKDLYDRSTPPLSAFLAAPFIYVFGEGALPARLPFAFCGLGCIVLMIWWLWKAEADGMTWLLMSLAIIGNVSFFLYSRQCRYYGPALLFSTAIAYLYFHWNGRRRTLVAMVFLSLCLMASNYIGYVALYVCLVGDYLIWGRKHRRLETADWAMLLLPQLIAGLLLAQIWNPFSTGFGQYVFLNSLSDKATLFWWNFRDLNRCEFGVGGLLLAAPLLYFIFRQTWLLRAPFSLFIYVLVVTLISPQLLSQSIRLTSIRTLVSPSVADVRYLAPIIPLCIAIGVLSLRTLSIRARWFAIALGMIAFGTNLLHGGPFLPDGFRSTIVKYVGELITPPGDPYTITARWINENVGERNSIWILPDYMAYPLMFHAPKAVYAWQIEYPPEPQFEDLDPIHFEGRIPPDYIVAFGPVVADLVKLFQSWDRPDTQYRLLTVLDHFWKDAHRPELFWRSFEPVTQYNKNLEAIYVLQRISPPIITATK
ncbi:hypothetical protein MYX65_03925 [Acidobacteria bacterium AH-259-L09]|nr:hypothetical protein [Acidobacteria bacterium AH-259-L09]